MYGADVSERIKRLEEGKSTVNTHLKTQLVLAANGQNKIDITPTETEKPRGDKPKQEGHEES